MPAITPEKAAALFRTDMEFRLMILENASRVRRDGEALQCLDRALHIAEMFGALKAQAACRRLRQIWAAGEFDLIPAALREFRHAYQDSYRAIVRVLCGLGADAALLEDGDVV